VPTPRQDLLYLLVFHFLKKDNFVYIRELYRGEVAQTMYTHVSKCKNDKRKKKAIQGVSF
jgi:hypothetical protein